MKAQLAVIVIALLAKTTAFTPWRHPRAVASTYLSAGQISGNGEFGSKVDKSVAKKEVARAPAPQPPAPESTTSGSGGLTKVDLGEGSQFMGGWIMENPSVCDDLLAVFEERRAAGSTLTGQVSMKGGLVPEVNKDVKDSEEMSFAPNDSSPAWRAYLQALQAAMTAYVGEYPMCGAYGTFGLVSRTNLQYYPPSGGYKTYHTERTGRGEPEGSRHLVFMTYLNDVTDAGGTEFYHQGPLVVQPRKGLTLIWPADWTFTHRGVPSPTQEKAIVTGWFNFNG